MINLLFLGGLIMAFIGIIYSLEDNNGSYVWWPALWLVTSGVIWWLWKDPVLENFLRWSTLGGVGIYLVAGILWSLFKWRKYIDYMYTKYTKRRADLPISNYKPYISGNEERITSWIVFWPFSVVRYILGNLVRDFFNWIITSLGGLYNRITDSKFK